MRRSDIIGMRRPGCAGLFAAACVLAFALAPSPADAAESGGARAQTGDYDPFAALVGKKRTRRLEHSPRTKVQHYALATDDRAFLFEDMGASARIKFLCADSDARLECGFEPQGAGSEIHELTPTRGPRGDIIFKNAYGEALLRIASYGGATVYWPGEAEGRAASKSYGDEQSLRLPFAGTGTADRRARRATAAISALAGAPIIFEFNEPATDEEAGAAVLADAVVMAAKGIAKVAADPTGAQVVAGRLRTVQFIGADAPGLSLDEKILEVRYNPSLDLDGRPSSAAVAAFLEESL